MAEVQGGDMHPGKPIIWPTGKGSSSPVNPTQASQASGGVRQVPTAPARPEAPAPTTPTAPAAKPTAPAKPSTPISRALNPDDIKMQLVNNGLAATDFNFNLAQKMLSHGLELSRENFVKILTLLEGSNQSESAQEAAMLGVMKNIDSPTAVKILTRYFSENPQANAQIQNLAAEIINLINALSSAKGMLNPVLTAKLNAILAQFEELLKDLPGKSRFVGNSSVDRGMVLNDARALKALLEALPQNMPQTPQARALAANIQNAANRLSQLIDNFTAQAILSQKSDPSHPEQNYQYYQIPNQNAKAPGNFEIAIFRDGRGKRAQIDEKDTKLVMSIETQNMGKLSICLTVKDKNIGVLFNTQNDEIKTDIAKNFAKLRDNFEQKGYTTTSFQAKTNPSMCHIKPYLIPMLGLDDLLKIDVEA